MFARLMALVIVLAAGGAEAQTNDDDLIATLYRSSTVIENARFHIATFNADKKSGGNDFAYNWGNCLIAADLFQNQPGVKVRYWCEKGRYRK